MTRRNLFQFAGGATAGALLTPAPWRLITDTALWSENWPGIPVPARGEIRTRYSNCTLCEAGCAVRARCVGDQPVFLAGARGGLCPYGLAAHHLPYHPARLRQGSEREAAGAVAGAMARLADNERIAVLDLRPGRTASWTYRRALAAVRNGTYIAASEPGAAVNLDQAKIVLSLGAPLLDGWGTPASVFAARPNFRLIQAEAVESRTAALADRWIPIRPGSENALAQGIAGAMSLESAALATGVPAAQIAELARELADHGPALVIDHRMSETAVALNVALGAWGRTVWPRREAPVPASWTKCAPSTQLEQVPDGSVRVLLIDESAPGEYIPWNDVRRKLVSDKPVVVAFAWSKIGYGRHAQFTLPTAVFPESVDDLPPAVDRAAACFRVSVPLVAAPEGMVDPVRFVTGIAGIEAGEPLRERAAEIHKRGKGTLIALADGQSQPVKEVKAEDFATRIQAGDWWSDDQAPASGAPKVAWKPFGPTETGAPMPLAIAFAEERGAATLISPLMTKLYQESGVRLAPNHVTLHPATAQASGVEEGGRAVLQAGNGECLVEISIDSSVAPGVVQVAQRPGVLDVCDASGTAKVVRA